MKRSIKFTIEDLKKSKVANLNASTLLDIYNTTGQVFSQKDIREFRLPINPMSKPRMVRSDAWKKRKCVVEYWAWKDMLLYEAREAGLSMLPGQFAIEFHIMMPDSWSKKKMREMDGKPHEAKPDLDNCIKAIQDCLCKSDSHVWNISAIKLWSYHGWIKIELPNT